MQLTMIISGGQTGADRGALDAAIDLGIEHGGWCPRGRRAEDGKIPDRYQLEEASTSSYSERTALNVMRADATLILSFHGLTGGSALTWRLAKGRRMSALLGVNDAAVIGSIRSFLDDAGPLVQLANLPPLCVLNVAGPRESKEPGIQAAVRSILREALKPYAWGAS